MNFASVVHVMWIDLFEMMHDVVHTAPNMSLERLLWIFLIAITVVVLDP